MPLLFRSLSHGEIPFGFFNIESDMIILGNYFLFASDFCENVSSMARSGPKESLSLEWDVYVLSDARIGNLMGAIAGLDLSGFIGEVYNHFPFPCDPDEFKQNPDGYKSRALVEGIIRKYVPRSRVAVVVDLARETIGIGEYLFSKEGFDELLRYIWQGGYPKWKAGIRPDYVLAMRRTVEQSNHQFFTGTAAFD
jgi:hypothetical protein